MNNTLETYRANPLSREGGLLRILDALLIPVENLLNSVAAVTIFIAMLATVANITSRIFGFPIPGYLEVYEQAIVIYAFLGAAYVQRFGSHIRMEIVIGALKGRARWLAETVSTMVSLVVVFVLIRYSWDFFQSAWFSNDTTPDSGIPTWPAKLLIPIALFIWFMRLSIELLGYIRLVVYPSAVPVGVPTIKSVEEHAQEELAEIFGNDFDAKEDVRK